MKTQQSCALSLAFAFSLFAGCSTDTPVVGQLDTSPLGDVTGLEDGVAVIEATVVSKGETTTYLSKSGHVMFDDGPVPELTVSEVEFVSSGDRGPDFDSYVATSRLASTKQAELPLIYTNGLYEVGRRYTLVLGPWGPDSMSILFGYDLAAQEPAPGFSYDTGPEVIRGLIAMSPTADASEAIGVAVADINRANQGGDVTEAAAYVLGLMPGPQPSNSVAAGPRGLDIGEGHYPFDRSGVPDELRADDLVDVEIIVFTDVGKPTKLALRGERVLGWFGVDPTLGYTIIAGVVPRHEPLDLVERADGDETGREARTGATIRATPVDDTSKLWMVLDVSADARADVAVDIEATPLSQQAFDVELVRLLPLLDATTVGPEPTD